MSNANVSQLEHKAIHPKVTIVWPELVYSSVPVLQMNIETVEMG